MHDLHHAHHAHHPQRVAIVGGGANDEHDVSLASAAGVAEAARRLGLDVVDLTIGRDGTWHRDQAPITAAAAADLITSCDAAFPVLHGVDGEDGTAAGFLRLVGTTVVGSPVRAGALGMDKWVTKTIAAAVGIRSTSGVRIPRGTDVSDLPLALPVVVKPATGGSSQGVSVVRAAGDLQAAVDRARAIGGDVLVEAFVAGREIDVAVFRDRHGTLRTGAPLEIGVEDGGVFGEDEKYDGSAVFTVPAPLHPDERAALERSARTLYETLGCAGVARFDFFLTPEGVVLNEVNTSPGFTEQSQVPRMYSAVGLPYDELVRALLDAALSAPAVCA